MGVPMANRVDGPLDRNSEAYNEGFQAFMDGFPQASCPYGLNTISADEWNEGWDTADGEMPEEGMQLGRSP